MSLLHLTSCGDFLIDLTTVRLSEKSRGREHGISFHGGQPYQRYGLFASQMSVLFSDFFI